MWSFFRSSTLCIANKLKKEKAASQAKTEKFYIQANISIDDTDSIFPSLLPASITTYVLITSLHFKNPYLPSLQSVQNPSYFGVNWALTFPNFSLCSPLLYFKTDSLLFPIYVQPNSTPASLSLFLTTWHSGISFKVLLHIPSTVKPLWVTTKLWSCICTFYHPLQFMFAFSTALLGIHMCLTFVERAMFESPLNFQNLAQCLAYGKPLINTCQWNEFMNQLHHWI